MSSEQEPRHSGHPISRREMLKLIGIGAVGVALGSGGILAAPGVRSLIDEHPTNQNKVSFYGKHQSGILTPHPRYVYFAALHCEATSRSELRELLQRWTEDSVRMMNGENLAHAGNVLLPPDDTGETKGLNAARLTLTYGLGLSLFERAEYGLQAKRPAEFVALPHFPRDQLDSRYTGGDLCIQACADDPQVAFHAVRNLVRAARGKVTMKWSQAGFNSYPVHKGKEETPRNLFAFKDGTGNPDVNNSQEMQDVVWVGAGASQSWLANGTYMVVRKIQMHLETWDRTSLKAQEHTFGRHRDSGAPLGKQREFEEMELGRTDEGGNPVVPIDSHVHLAKQVKDRILRRSFSYTNDIDPQTGHFDAGLLFVSYQRDPGQFVRIQNQLGRADKLNEYITHRGSGLFVCLPGAAKGSYLGAGLLD
ncbi:iron uptake transporter deferrochelatase/peroxidase subunit [Paenibacillus sp. SYP-B4298]|uniref:iron uptake transporter deferrochelatase/peroxidase subunit n=1 Tax=Paenibacillus sp. SYP-B4298 TaxID=2996034 RepID=UPI0022DD975E|nr:iron uptake transporter deferrochelatase/peroxidase subunit [Paenibacillus sp. SYP-B4298]